MDANKELHTFLEPYDKAIQNLTIELRRFITELIPEANELIWDNYNAVAIAYSKSEKLKDAFCHLAIYPKHVNFGFNRGSELERPLLELKGNGKLIRHIPFNSFQAFPIKKITTMLLEAISIADQRNNQLIDKMDVGKSLVMSISDKKIRPKKSTK